VGTRQTKQKRKKEDTTEKKKAKSTTIVRIAGKDVDGSYKIPDALRQIKGIGHNLADSLSVVIEEKLGISRETPVGELSEQQIEQIEDVIHDPVRYGVPEYQVNFARNPLDNKYVHLISNDLVITVRNLIQKERAMKTWRGYRHSTNKGKVRGQKTRRTGRKGMTVGVVRKKNR